MKSLTIPSVRTDFDYIVITGAIIYNAKNLILNLHLANEDDTTTMVTTSRS